MEKSFSLEGHIKELESIESYFQDSNMNIDEAIKKHQQAVKVSAEVLDYLKKAETTIAECDISGALKNGE